MTVLQKERTIVLIQHLLIILQEGESHHDLADNRAWNLLFSFLPTA